MMICMIVIRVKKLILNLYHDSYDSLILWCIYLFINRNFFFLFFSYSSFSFCSSLLISYLVVSTSPGSPGSPGRPVNFYLSWFSWFSWSSWSFLPLPVLPVLLVSILWRFIR